jgi:hypothetical protein
VTLAEIEVTRGAGAEPLEFVVTVTEAGGSTRHDVTLSAADLERLGGNQRSPEDVIRSCFEFLLEREPKESILHSFDVSVIGRYFPEFEREMQER